MKILVSCIKQRDVDHFEMVYNYYMPVLYRFAMQYAYDSETAKDLVHDAFAWVWNNPDKIRDEGNVAALLYRLVRSNCLNYLRSLDIRDCNDRKYADAAVFTDFLFDDEPDDRRYAIELRLRHALNALPERGREALEMHFVGNMRIKAIAEVMHVSEATVKTHIKRALKALREGMKCLFSVFL